MNNQNVKIQQEDVTEEKKLLQMLYEEWQAQRVEAKQVGYYKRTDKQEYVLSLLSEKRRVRKAKILLKSFELHPIADSFTARGPKLFKKHLYKAMIDAQEQNLQETAFLLEQIISIMKKRNVANSCKLLFEYIKKT